MLDAGEQVVQAMAELMEQGGDFVVGQQRRLARRGRGKVAHQVRHRALQAAGGSTATVASAVHPGTATLVGAGVQVEEEAAHVLAVFLISNRRTSGCQVSKPLSSAISMPYRRCTMVNRPESTLSIGK